LGIKCLSYPAALGELTKKYFTIAIAGTHGKSTTTAMIGLILVKAGLDPTVIVGTKLEEFGRVPGGSNCRVGKSEYLVIEADEHKASFLKYFPKIIVLTNIEKDHLDFYKNLDNILNAFKKFVSHLPKEGILVVNGEDENIKKTLKYTGRSRVCTHMFSLGQKEEIKVLKKILKVPGEYNISNALAALTVARTLKIPDKISFKALSEYKGAWRRFEEKDLEIQTSRFAPCNRKSIKKNLKVKIINDYAHHPTEIKVTLKAAREKYPKKKIYCVFQPHQYQRTFYLFDKFVEVLRSTPVDKLIITDIYEVAGREAKKIKKKVNSKKLVEAIKKTGKNKTIYLPNETIAAYLKKNLKGGEVVIIMGAGDIYKLAEQF
jgi:UDP-N-acetylmuramate--alanine ligase